MALADWDARLITPARALELAGDWPVWMSAEWADLAQFETEGGAVQASRWQLNMRCGKCGQSCGLLTQAKPGLLAPSFERADTSPGDLLSGVLRHMVMAHDVPLNRSHND
jgi:hypothetical protein